MNACFKEFFLLQSSDFITFEEEEKVLKSINVYFVKLKNFEDDSPEND